MIPGKLYEVDRRLPVDKMFFVKTMTWGFLPVGTLFMYVGPSENTTLIKKHYILVDNKVYSSYSNVLQIYCSRADGEV